MSQTLFLKDNKLFIRLKESEFEVSNPEIIGFFESGNFFLKSDEWGTGFLTDPIEWTGKVELIEIDTVEDGGGCYVAGSKTVARLLPEDKKDYLFEINPTLSSSNSSTAHSFTESAYKEFEASENNGDWKNLEKEVCKCDLCKLIETHNISQSMIDEAMSFINLYAKNPVSASSESQEDMWHSWEEGAILGKEVDVMLYDGSVLNNCIPQADGDFYYKPFVRFIDIAAVKQWKYSFENLYD